MKTSFIAILTIAILMSPSTAQLKQQEKSRESGVGSLESAVESFKVQGETRAASPRTPDSRLQTPDLKTAGLDQLIPRLMKEGNVPGLSIAVIGEGKIVMNHGFGVKSVATREPVTDDTVFEAASLSKPVMAYAVLKLVDAGKLDLDKPLSQYLDKPYIDNDDRLNLITARRVLTHTTGFPNWRPRRQALKIILPPGERFSYSGEGFVYLQKVIERISGQSLDDFARKTVFEPLGMTSSAFVWRPDYETRKATGHDAAGNASELRKPIEANAAASLQTTSLDYAKFVIALLNGTGLKESTSKAMLSPQIWVDEGCSNCIARPPTGKLSTEIAWGFGVGLQQTKDGSSFWHWGDNGDVHCYMIGYPKQHLGIVVFTNSGNGHTIIPEIIKAAVGGEQPAGSWLRYEPYDSPGKTFYKEIVARGVVAIEQYREQRKNQTAPFAINEAQTNNLGYSLLRANHLKEAIEIFKLNVQDYPNSANAYDSLAEAYVAAGDKDLAIKNYEKSVELNPKNDGGIEALKKLRAP